MSDPIKKTNDNNAEANRALRESAQQRRVQQQEQAAQQRKAAQQNAKAQADAAADAARKNAQMRAAAAQRRQASSAAQSAQQRPAAPRTQTSAASNRARSASLDLDRDEAPIRQRRDGQTGCLGVIIYFAFVCSIHPHMVSSANFPLPTLQWFCAFSLSVKSRNVRLFTLVSIFISRPINR